MPEDKTAKKLDSLSKGSFKATSYKWSTKEIIKVCEIFTIGGLPALRKEFPGFTDSQLIGTAKRYGAKKEGMGPRKSITWTEHLDRQVKKVYQEAKPREIRELAKRLNVSRGQIQYRAMKLGCFSHSRGPGKGWLPEEDTILQEYGNLGFKAIQQKLRRYGYGRSLNAIASRMQLLKAKTDNPDCWKAKELADLLGLNEKTIVNWINKGWLKSSKEHGHFVVPRKIREEPRIWYIYRYDFMRFVQNYGSLIDLRKVNQLWFMDFVTSFWSIKPGKEKKE